MYDQDYQAYIKVHFAEQPTCRPWALDLPGKIFGHTKLTGMSDLSKGRQWIIGFLVDWMSSAEC